MDEPLFEIYQLRGDQGGRTGNHLGSFVHPACSFIGISFLPVCLFIEHLLWGEEVRGGIRCLTSNP